MAELQSLLGRLEEARIRLQRMRDQREKLLAAIAEGERQVKTILAEVQEAALGRVKGAAPARKRRSAGELRDRVIGLLLAEDAMRAAEIAARLGCSMPSVYACLVALKKEAVVVALEDHHFGLTYEERDRRRIVAAGAGGSHAAV